MGLILDLHVHTRRYSPCSQIDPARLIAQAVKAGLDGLVITEHGRQWSQDELDELVERGPAPGFLVLSGFEYTSSCGDLLVYGIEAGAEQALPPGLSPGEAVAECHKRGGVCLAAHPTRQGLGFDDRIVSLGLAAIEVASVNLLEHEQRLAKRLSEQAGIPAVWASDAHRLADVGRYATEFPDPIRSMGDLRAAFKSGRFHMPGRPATSR